MDKLDYSDILSQFVDAEYVNMIDEDVWDYVEEYCDRGGSPEVCVGLGLAETEDLGWNYERIASELNTSRKSIYNARKALDLVEKEPRGIHVD